MYGTARSSAPNSLLTQQHRHSHHTVTMLTYCTPHQRGGVTGTARVDVPHATPAWRCYRYCTCRRAARHTSVAALPLQHQTCDSQVVGSSPTLAPSDVVSVLNVSVSRQSRVWRRFLERLGLVSVLKISRLSLGFRDFRSCEQAGNAPGLRIYQEENNGSDPQETGCEVTDFTS